MIKNFNIILENIIISIKANKDYPFILDKNIMPLDENIKNEIGRNATKSTKYERIH